MYEAIMIALGIISVIGGLALIFVHPEERKHKHWRTVSCGSCGRIGPALLDETDQSRIIFYHCNCGNDIEIDTNKGVST